jgi:thiamine pyrophosphate-dependent acetolactate synthase large subunit-like protein
MAMTVAEGLWEMLGPGLKPIRPEYVAAVLSELADDDAVFTVDTGTPCIWAARQIEYGRGRRLFGSFTWASMANAAPNAFGAALAFPGRQTIALQAALAHTGGPVVVDVVVDPYALALPSHVPATTAKGFTLSMAKQVFNGKMDEVIETIEHNVRLL